MKVGIFFFGSLYERTGAGKVVKSFADNHNLFKKNNIETKVYDLSSQKSAVPSKSSKLKKIKGKFRDLIAKTKFGAKYCIENLYFHKGDKVIRQYLNLCIKDDVLVFHEIFTCWAYIDNCEKNNVDPQKYILVLHTNGEIFKMLKIYFPKLCNTNYENEIEKRALKCLDNAGFIVFVSNKSEQHFNCIYNNKYKHKTRVVYNGISALPISNFPSFDGEIRIVTVGTVNARKNQILQLDCISELIPTLKVKLTIVGDGEKLDECKKKAKELGIDDYVRFLGARDDIPQILSESNLFLMSSYDEGLPISAIEAMRSKLPLILTDVGGNRELIDGNGILVEPQKESIVKALKTISEDNELQLAMSNRSYDLYLTKFSVGSMIDSYSDLIKELNS